MEAKTLDHHIERQLDNLRREFAGQVPTARVTAVGEAWFHRLRMESRVMEFIPVLGYRFAQDELRRGSLEELSRAG